jgi:hypothetical protein
MKARKAGRQRHSRTWRHGLQFGNGKEARPKLKITASHVRSSEFIRGLQAADVDVRIEFESADYAHEPIPPAITGTVSLVPPRGSREGEEEGPEMWVQTELLDWVHAYEKAYGARGLLAEIKKVAAEALEAHPAEKVV